jgi:hypothetical protein
METPHVVIAQLGSYLQTRYIHDPAFTESIQTSSVLSRNAKPISSITIIDNPVETNNRLDVPTALIANNSRYPIRATPRSADRAHLGDRDGTIAATDDSDDASAALVLLRD